MNKPQKNFCLTKVLPEQHFPFHAKCNVHRTKVFAEHNFCLTKLFPIRYLSTGLMAQYSQHHNEDNCLNKPFLKRAGSQGFNIYSCEVTQCSYEATTYLLQTNSAFNLLLTNVPTGCHIFGILPVQSFTLM